MQPIEVRWVYQRNDLSIAIVNQAYGPSSKENYLTVRRDYLIVCVLVNIIPQHTQDKLQD